MKTYILKYDVYNNIDFPKGTIVKVNDWKWEFEVMEGKLKGEKGHIADGMNGFLLEDIIENRKLFKEFTAEQKKLEDAVNSLNKKWNALQAVTAKNYVA